MPKTHPLTAKDKTAKMMKEVPIEEKADTLNTQTARKKAATEDFVVEMKRYDRIRGIGMKTMATMTDVSAKAAELWGKRFGPRMKEISGLHPGSLGICVFSSREPGAPYEYWAVVQASDGEAIPAGMSEVVVDAQNYVEVETTMSRLREAYAYLFGEWSVRHPEHKLSAMLPTVEFYPADFMASKKVSLRLALERNKD